MGGLSHPQDAPNAHTNRQQRCRGIANDTVKQRRSKSRRHALLWVCDRVRRGHFLIYRLKGSTSLAFRTVGDTEDDAAEKFNYDSVFAGIFGTIKGEKVLAESDRHYCMAEAIVCGTCAVVNGLV